jgi:transposase
MTMDRIEVITSVERRRRWSRAEKARLVAAMEEPGATWATAFVPTRQISP